ncbi:unannotated protein [freshwater metagenome]|uniref:Unannotated protein n=1 Tax=freshwater metagenome TaxID=449393 RepID=A0A6J5ZTU8_9ZZZZ
MVIGMTADGTVARNSNLRDARKAKNDEFYTQWARLVRIAALAGDSGSFLLRCY